MDGFTWAKDIEELGQLIRPSSHTRRIEWNKRWEEDLARVYNEKILIYPGLRRTKHTRESLEYEKGATQGMLLVIEGRTESTLIVQRRVADRAVRKLMNDDLEGRWKNMADGHRKDIILEAIYRTSCIPGGWEDARKWCPDVTISNMSANQGKLFIDWLRLLISNRQSRLEVDLQPVLFPHSLLDKIMEAMDLEIFRRFDLLTRSYWISFVLWYILLEIYNEPDFQHSGVSKAARQVGTVQFALKAAEKMHGKETARNIKKEWKEYLVECQASNSCYYCKKRAEPLKQLTLKACVKCKEIGRIIRYCSRECQILDWKKGTVRPHKQMCGKPLQLDDSFDPKPKSDPEGLPARVPEPAPGFQRSLALEFQLNFVHGSSADYTLVATKSNEDHIQIRFPSPDSEDAEQGLDIFPRVGFLIMRNRAFTNGDSNAVKLMFGLCIPLLEEQGIPAERLAAQLEREFSVKVDDEYDLNSVTAWTEEEMDWALRLIAVFEILEELRVEYCSS